MAGVKQVLDMAYNQVISAVYPNGTSQPSIAGIDVTIIEGWPIRNKLDDVLRAGNAMISVFDGGKSRTAIKFVGQEYQTVSINPATITADVSGQTVTIGGTISVPQSVMVIVNGTGFAYQVLISDTPDTIAEALADLIPGATVLGAVITIPDAHSLQARIATAATAATELGRQERIISIKLWCPTPDIRDAMYEPIGNIFKKNYRVVLADGFYCHIFPAEPAVAYDDSKEIPLVYMGNIEINVRYASTEADTFTTITQPVTNIETVQEIPS